MHNHSRVCGCVSVGRGAVGLKECSLCQNVARNVLHILHMNIRDCLNELCGADIVGPRATRNLFHVDDQVSATDFEVDDERWIIELYASLFCAFDSVHVL